jgi:hypothetical protein
MLQAKEHAPTLDSSVVFTFESIQELGSTSIGNFGEHKDPKIISNPHVLCSNLIG